MDGDEEVDGLGEMENKEGDGRTETGVTETEGMEAGGTEADGRGQTALQQVGKKQRSRRTERTD